MISFQPIPLSFFLYSPFKLYFILSYLIFVVYQMAFLLFILTTRVSVKQNFACIFVRILQTISQKKNSAKTIDFVSATTNCSKKLINFSALRAQHQFDYIYYIIINNFPSVFFSYIFAAPPKKKISHLFIHKIFAFFSI